MSPRPPRSLVDRRTFTPQQPQIIKPDTSGSYIGSQDAPNNPYLTSHPPVPDQLRRGHSIPYGQQHTVQLGNTPAAGAQASEPGTSQPQPAAQPYDFIMNEPPPAKRSLPGGDSKIVRIAYILGGLLLILLIFMFVRGLLSPGPNLEPFVTVAQDQQEMIRLATNAGQQQDLSVTNKNLAMTAQLSLTTAQSQTITYLANNKKKVNPKTLNLKIDPAVDTRLQTAAAATTYNQTFKEIMAAKLQNYISDLDHAYKQKPGKNGQALLKDNYAQAQLLLKQLDAPTT